MHPRPNAQDSSTARPAVNNVPKTNPKDANTDQKPAKQRDLSDLTKQVQDSDLFKGG